MTPQEIERIEKAIRHIQTAADVDQWAAEIAVESMRKRITPTSVIVENGWKTKNDIAIHIINEIRNIIIKDDSWTEDATTAVNEAVDMAIKALSSAKSERKKGKWVQDDIASNVFRCSECGCDAPVDSTAGCEIKSNFCQWCGIDMRGD